LADLGVQVLFGFLLSLPFTSRWPGWVTRSAGCTWWRLTQNA